MTSSQDKKLPTTVSLAFIFLPEWWQNAFSQAKSQVSYFVLPAILLILSNIAALYADNLLRVSLPAPAITQDLNQLMFMSVALLGLTFLSLGLGGWSLYIWLPRLTQLCAVYIKYGSNFCDDDFKSIKSQNFEQAGVFSQLWFWGSLLILPPVVLLSILIAAQVTAGLCFPGFERPLLVLPLWSTYIFPLLISICTLIIAAYIFSLIALSSVSRLSPWQTAWFAFKLCFKQGLEITALTILILLFNLLICFLPQILLSAFSKDLYSAILAQLWLGITVPFVYPISVLSYAQLIKPIAYSLEPSLEIAN